MPRDSKEGRQPVSGELYEKRLGHVERDVSEMRGRLSGVEDKLGGVDGKLDRLLQRDISQPYTAKDMLGMAVQVAVLIGLCVSAIVYVAGGYYSADIALLKHKVSELRSQQSTTWSTQVKR